MFRPPAKPVISPERARWRHSGHTPRRNAGLAAYENALARAGLSPVAGIDEAGRGACAGPLVVAAVVLDCATIRRIPGLADSKLLTPEERETIYAGVLRWALDWHVVTIPPQEVDALGLHVCNVAGMRRALAGLRQRPGYVLTDGFPVRGLGTPALAVWKGDQVTASVAAASVLAKVTRDRMMVALGESYPAYGFARHKGYSTPEHMTALCAWGPCPEHRYSYTNVLQANRRWSTGWQGETADLEAAAFADDDLPGEGVPAAADDLPGERVPAAADDLPGEGAPVPGPAAELAPGKLAPGNGTGTPDGWADLGAEAAAAAAASRAIPVGLTRQEAENKLGASLPAPGEENGPMAQFGALARYRLGWADPRDGARG
jgi:ribonuclease HII